MPDALGFGFTWYGHSCVRVETEDGTTILLDPWFGNPRSPAPASSIERCDVLLVSHGHHDHLGSVPGEVADADALTIARRTKPTWPCIHELSLWLEHQPDLGAEVIGMNKGGTVSVRGVDRHDRPRRPLGRRLGWRRVGAALSRRAGRVRHRAAGRLSRLLRRRHGALRGHAAHRRAPPA